MAIIINPQDKISILVNEAKKVNLEDLQDNFNDIITLQAYLIQTVYELNLKINEGEVYIESLITKIIFASKSVFCLSKPQSIELYNSQNKIENVDTPSIFILARSIIETFLTLEYLYFDNCSDSEKEFRFKLWRVSGFISRQAFLTKSQKSILKS